MPSQALSAKMRRQWADPEWRAKVIAAMQEGRTRSLKHNGRKNPKGTQIGQMRCVGARFEQETFDRLAAESKRTGKAIAELIRTYVEWGLETEGAAND